MVSLGLGFLLCSGRLWVCFESLGVDKAGECIDLMAVEELGYPQ